MKFLLKLLRYLALAIGALVLLMLLIGLSGRYDPGTIAAIPFLIIAGILLLRRFLRRRKIRKELDKIEKSQAKSAAWLDMINERRRRLRAGEPVIQVHDHRMKERAESGVEPIDKRRRRSSFARRRRFPIGPPWREGATRSQKIFLSILFASMLSAAVALFGFQQFTVAEGVAGFCAYASIALTLLSMVGIEYLSRRDSWKVGPEYHAYSRYKFYLVVVPSVAFLLFGLFWLNLARGVPLVYTMLAGEPVVIEERVERRIGSRRTFCGYMLAPETINSLGLRYCIGESEYRELPDGYLSASLELRRSRLGAFIDRISINGKAY